MSSSRNGAILMASIIVRIRNGTVESIEGVPTDMFVEVRNYDVINVPEEKLSRDINGDLCYVKEWNAPE